jgi:phosphatidate cytidylyltransferase
VATPEFAHAAGDALPPTAPSPRKRFDVRRVYTAAILAPAVWIIIRYLPPWAFTMLVVVGGSIALFELYRMALGGSQAGIVMAVGMVTAGMVIARSHLNLTLADVLLPGTLAMLVAMLLTETSNEHRLRDAAVAVFGVLYVGLTLGTLVSTRALPAGEWLVLFVALVTWAADTGAYYAGSLWGRHPLAPRISPKKSIEGLAGGLALAVAVALLARAWFLSDFSVADAVILGAVLTMAGLCGDLCESAIKRSAGVKDSGGILPGHGGMLDRLDSLLFAAPVFYYYIALVRGYVPLA